MLAFLKSIFGGRTTATQRNVGLTIPRTVYTPQPRSGSHRPSKTPAQRPAQKPAPVPEPVPAPAPVPESVVASEVDISLQAVLKGLPPDLKDRVRDLDIRGATMTISLERILAQLPSGPVKISFGSLRHAAPQLFSAGADCDSRDVTLPLDEILAKVNPAMICRPQEQPAKRSDDSTLQGQNGTESDASVPDDAACRADERASSLSVPPIAPPGESQDDLAPASNGPDKTPAKPRHSRGSRRTTPKRAEKAAPSRFPTAPPAKHEATVESVQPAACVTVALDSLTGSWPTDVQQQIAHWKLSDAKIALPAESVREGMERGRITFPWKTLRSWITPQPPEEASSHDGVTVELPIAVIAPLFLDDQKQPAKSSREEIPDLFFEARQAEHSTTESGNEAAAAPIAPQPDASEAQSVGQPAQAPADKSVMRIPLKELTELWPENVRAEVAHWNLEQLMVALPGERINAALKQGRVIFPWENLRSWILPAPPSATSLLDKALLELPLPVIMPLFLAARKQSKPGAQVQPQIGDDIPDPFADFLPPRTGAPAHVQQASAALAAVVAAPADAGTPASIDNASANAAQPCAASPSEETQTVHEPETAQISQSHPSTPAEVLTNAMSLEGVAGALIALPDGFKVASKLPPGLDGDALAAFLPHIFNKVNQSTRELRMGDLNNLNFTVDNVPWKIFRVNQIFFAALGHAGKPMPTDQLAALAHKLTFKN